MSRSPFHRLAIRGVRQRALLGLTVGVLAIPAGLAVVADPAEPRVQPRPRGPRAVAERSPPEHRPTPVRAGEAEPLAPAVREERQRVADLGNEPTPALVQRLQSTELSERLAAANLLWARNERAVVREAASQSGDRALLAKVHALEHRSR